MNVLTNALTQSMIANILDFDPHYVVPKQGNWWNPQDSAALLQAVLPDSQRPQTWCAFTFEGGVPIDSPHYVQDSATPPQNWMVQHKKDTLVLQFVGTDAKRLADTVGFWVIREDVQAQFSLVDGKICGSSGAVTSVDFLQEGNNSVKAYTARLDVIYAVEIETGQDILESATFGGVVTAT